MLPKNGPRPPSSRTRILASHLALSPGTRLGIYEITAPIGEGAMGQVYRATDTTLSRQVAIKILPDAFACDSERVARFEREAKTLASLNHPNIAAIYGFEKSTGLHALVMELVEGDDLSQRITKGAIKVDEALSIAKQIAEALEAAHEQGIIHRDLKPANIKVRADGAVKVLDFGLAKAIEPTGASLSASQSPTITPAMTQSGIILGTAIYMSPEQARGKPVDKRTDIWAFGCVLYEMLTGRRAFRGETLPDTIVAILEREAGLDRVAGWRRRPRSVVCCSAASRKIRAAAFATSVTSRHWLEDVASGPDGVGIAASAWPRRGLAWLLGGVALASAALAGWLLWMSPAEAPARNVQLQRLTDLSGWRSRRRFRRTARLSRSWHRPAASARSGSGCWPEGHRCKSPVTTPTTSSRGGRRIRAPSSTLCRRRHQESTARSGRSAALGGEPRRVAAGAQRRRHQP